MIQVSKQLSSCQWQQRHLTASSSPLVTSARLGDRVTLGQGEPNCSLCLIQPEQQQCWGHEAATFQFPDETLKGTDSWREMRVGGGWPTSPLPPSLLQLKAPASPALCSSEELPTRSRQKKSGTGFLSSPPWLR